MMLAGDNSKLVDPVPALAHSHDAFPHLNTIDGYANREKITVGSYDRQDTVEDWALHRWLRENGAAEEENVLLLSEGLA